MKNEVIETITVLVAVAVVIVGLHFTSVGVGPGHLMQNDGYNVTGGFMALIGGLFIGRWWGMRGRSSKKK